MDAAPESNHSCAASALGTKGTLGQTSTHLPLPLPQAAQSGVLGRSGQQGASLPLQEDVQGAEQAGRLREKPKMAPPHPGVESFTPVSSSTHTPMRRPKRRLYVCIWYIGIALNAATSIPRSLSIACTQFGERPIPDQV